MHKNNFKFMHSRNNTYIFRDLAHSFWTKYGQNGKVTQNYGVAHFEQTMSTAYVIGLKYSLPVKAS